MSSQNVLEGIQSFPRVGIIGRPNVGKSTLFNLLTSTRKSVVRNQPGVTRDIIIESCDVWGKNFDLIDTGGVTEAKDTFSKLIREQVIEFLKDVDLLLVVMDGRAGLVPEDREIVRLAIEAERPFLMIINKVDSIKDDESAKADFYEFGRDLVVCSFEQRRGVSDMLEWLHKHLPEQKAEIREGVRIAVVGKPNAGKSSLVNSLLGEKRMLVSEIAGTTIDAVDTPFVYNDKKFILVDTAGLRRSARREEDLEIISAFKSQESIRRADIVLLVVDAVIGPTDQDARILQSVLEDHKAVILVLNKSDLGKSEIENFRKVSEEAIQRQLHFFTDIISVYTSAKTGFGLKDLLNKIEWLSGKLNTKIPTSQLNDFFFDVIRKAPAPVYGVNNVKFYYLTQTYQQPPAFIAFANHPDGVDNAYRRFLIKNIKEEFDLKGIPIRIFVMKSRRGERRAEN